MVNLNIRVKQFALPESGERKRNNHPGLGKRRSETKPVPTEGLRVLSESAQMVLYSPYPVLKNDFFPFLSESSALILDDSLCTEGLCVHCLVCSNLGADITGLSKSMKGKCNRFMTHCKEFNPLLKKSIACCRSQGAY